MDSKTKNFLENLRLKTKLPNLRRPGKKTPGKQGKKLAYRRSISVPDLRLDQSEAFSTGNPLPSTASDAVFFGTSPSQSDTDSYADGSDTCGPVSADSQTDSAPVTRRRAATDNTAVSFYRMSAPVNTQAIYEEMEDVMDSGSESNVSTAGEIYAQVNKRSNIPRENVPAITFAPVPAPRSAIANTQLYARPNLVEREIISAETARTPEEADRAVPGSIAAVLARANSLREHANLRSEKKTTFYDQRQSSSEKGTPPAVRGNAQADRWSLIIDSLGTTGESAEGFSLDSGTPSEEQVNMPWTTDSEEMEREPLSTVMDEFFSMDEAQLEALQRDEAQEETFEVS